MMKKLARIAFAASLTVGLSGIAAAYDCANAQDDIQRLQSEKQSSLERAANGISAILPIGFVAHTLEGNEDQSLNEMDTDDYNRHLDQRISQIKARCNLP